jgi:hypothetical protein
MKQIMNQIGKYVNNQVWYRIEDQVDNEIISQNKISYAWVQISNHIHRQVIDQVKYQLGEQIENI